MNLILLCDWLSERARWRYLVCSGLGAVFRKKSVSRSQVWFSNVHIIKSFIDQACSVKMAGYWPLCDFADLDSVSVHNHAKKTMANIQPSWPHAWSITHISWPQDCSVTHILIALRVKIRFSSSAWNFIKTVRTSPQLPPIKLVDCGTCSRETVSDFSQDTRYLNNNNNNNMQWIPSFTKKNWHRCRKVIIKNPSSCRHQNGLAGSSSFRVIKSR